jgi:carbonic anhydrase
MLSNLALALREDTLYIELSASCWVKGQNLLPTSFENQVIKVLIQRSLRAENCLITGGRSRDDQWQVPFKGGLLVLTRRLFCGCLAAASFVATAAHAQSECAVFTAERQKNTTPDQAVALLKEGNQRLLAGKPTNCDLVTQVKDTAAGQAPFAAIVGCIDSRVSPELIFDQGVGDIFCARIAGNFVNTDIIGSLEFATRVMGAKAIVVLGHNDCGAIKGAIDKVKLGNLTATLQNIEPAIRSLGNIQGKRDSSNYELVQQVAIANAKLAAQNIQKRSKVVADLIKAGQLKVLAAMQDLATGEVTWLS